MREIVINGQFCARRLTGEERFAEEIVIELDKLCSNVCVKLVVPENASRIPNLKNIKVVKYGRVKGFLWEQIFFGWYALVHRAITLNLCSIMPIIKPGVVCIHDIKYKVAPVFKKQFSLYNWFSKIWHLFQYHLAWKCSPIIYTVSQYSKKQIEEVYNVDSDKIIVLGNGWDHFKRIEFDDSIFNRKKELFEKPFFFSVSSVTPNKNVKWTINVAKRHPQYNFLIGGHLNRKAFGGMIDVEIPENVFFMGYLSDGEVKSLMRRCKAFIFPSFAEGFGIPPLEALSVGAQAIISNTTCLPEIFEDTVHYIDPNNPNVDLDELLSVEVNSPNDILDKYRYANFAQTIVKNLLS